MASLKQLADDLFGLFFPNLCTLCSQELISEEKHICNSCLLSLPQANFQNQNSNALEQKFQGRIDFEKALSLYYFNTDSKVQDMLHEIKYRSNNQLAHFMGQLMYHKLAKEFSNIDLVVAIPLHKRKERERGFNQSVAIAEGFCEGASILHNSDVVKRLKYTESQTSKTRVQRIENMVDAFQWFNNVDLRGKRILLIDDVITTGSTIESCIQAAPKEWDIKFSILSLAVAIDS